jgi:hypothetical protein
MDANQTKMMQILVDVKNIQMHGSVKPIVAEQSLAKTNDIGLMREPVLTPTTEVGNSTINLTKKLPTFKGISSVIICDEEDVADKEEFGSTISQRDGKNISLEYQRRRATRMKMTPDVEGANVAKKLAFTSSPSSFKRTLPPTQLNKRSKSLLRTPGLSTNYFMLSPNEAVLPKVSNLTITLNRLFNRNINTIL